MAKKSGKKKSGKKSSKKKKKEVQENLVAVPTIDDRGRVSIGKALREFDVKKGSRVCVYVEPNQKGKGKQVTIRKFKPKGK